VARPYLAVLANSSQGRVRQSGSGFAIRGVFKKKQRCFRGGDKHSKPAFRLALVTVVQPLSEVDNSSISPNGL
jgi:hypothetical protein